MKRLGAFLLILMMFLMTSCGKTEGKLVTGGENTAVSSEEETEAEEDSTSDTIYIIEAMDMAEETLTLLSTSTGSIYRYPYSLTTKFLDQYGNSASWSRFVIGTAVQISNPATSGALTQVQMSDATWTYEDITRYSIDTSKNLMTIGDSNYKLLDDTVTFSNDAVSTIDTIGDSDTLRVVGLDNQIYSIVITTGHGYIKLMNTELFDGSMLQIGSKLYTRVSDGLTIEVEEGTYTVTAANNGYGGSADYTVTRNAETVINLEDLKGEGPKYCDLSFTTSVEGASVYLDGELMALGEVKQVQYGTHSLQVVAEGYESWNKTLYVNSAKAEIVLELTEEDETTEDSTTTSSSSSTDSSSSSSNSSSSSSNSSSSNSSTSSSSSSSDSDNADVDYLTTLSSVISGLMDSD